MIDNSNVNLSDVMDDVVDDVNEAIEQKEKLKIVVDEVKASRRS